MHRQIKDYNTITSGCAESCQRLRRSGLPPQTVIRTVCAAADIRYGGCPSETGPELLPNGTERCHLPTDSGKAVDVFNAAAEILINETGRSPDLQPEAIITV